MSSRISSFRTKCKSSLCSLSSVVIYIRTVHIVFHYRQFPYASTDDTNYSHFYFDASMATVIHGSYILLFTLNSLHVSSKMVATKQCICYWHSDISSTLLQWCTCNICWNWLIWLSLIMPYLLLPCYFYISAYGSIIEVFHWFIEITITENMI